MLEYIRTMLDLFPGTMLRFWLFNDSNDPYAPSIVTSNTDLVFEGFPRSANTFSYYILQESFPTLSIAHHVHSWQQFFFARIWDIPTIMLLREPDAAVSSLVTKKDVSTTLGYLQYSLFYGFSGKVDATYLFEDVISNDFSDKLLERVSTLVNAPNLPPNFKMVDKLMASRTNMKNINTKILDVEKFGILTRIARFQACRTYSRLKNESSGSINS